jgi:hypothetical protein
VSATRAGVRAPRSRALAICGAALLALLAVSGAERAEAGARHCAQIISRVGPGYTKATVLIVSGRVDCEKSRRVIYKALSGKRYGKRRIAGWSCTSTRPGRSGVFGARCESEGYVGREVIKSSVPQRCPGCHGTRK